MFYNTTNETNPDLAEFRQKAATQDEAILTHFKDYPWAQTPSEIQQKVLPNSPLTSVRRSITNLTADGKLAKTALKGKGLYGRNEYKWRLA